MGRRIGGLNIDEEVPQNMLPPHLNLPQNAQHAFNVCEDDDTFYDNRRNNSSPGPSPQGSQDDVYNNWQVKHTLKLNLTALKTKWFSGL